MQLQVLEALRKHDLGEYDALFLRRSNGDLLVFLSWRVWARLLERGRP
jgi:hypothetical protein